MTKIDDMDNIPTNSETTTDSKYWVQHVDIPKVAGRIPSAWKTCLGLAHNLFSPEVLNQSYVSQMTLARAVGYKHNGYIAGLLKQMKIYRHNGKYIAESTPEQRAWIMYNGFSVKRMTDFQRLSKKLKVKANQVQEQKRINSRRPAKKKELEKENELLKAQNAKLQALLQNGKEE